MPAKKIIADAGEDIWKVKGSNIDKVARLPRPGSTPTNVPINTPLKHKIIFSTLNAVENPNINDENKSIYNSYLLEDKNVNDPGLFSVVYVIQLRFTPASKSFN